MRRRRRRRLLHHLLLLLFSISTFLETSKNQLTVAKWVAVLTLESCWGQQRLTVQPRTAGDRAPSPLLSPLFLFASVISSPPLLFLSTFPSFLPCFFLLPCLHALAPFSFLTAVPECMSFSRPPFCSRILIRPWLHITACAFVGWWMAQEWWIPLPTVLGRRVRNILSAGDAPLH